ncbi:hypothetical protein [Curtobacterium sp. MCBD17_026]|uniref:hypothetical protein n=1 Tax=Curtobacterium sp. MCBD17_026 TaxID=2175621 RepID=UPI0026CDDA2B
MSDAHTPTDAEHDDVLITGEPIIDPRIRGRAIGVLQTASSIGMALFPLTLGLFDSRFPWALWTITTAVFIAAAWAWRAALKGLPGRVQIASTTDLDA